MDALDALRRIGAESILGILVQVLESLPEGWCMDRKERNRRLAAMPNRWAVLGTLTDSYYNAIESESNTFLLSRNVYTAYVREGFISE